MLDYLKNFDKRMEFVACIASIIKRKNTNKALESLFEPYELDNVIMSVLVHIMEKTLLEEDECTLGELQDFLSQLLVVYQKKDFTPETIKSLTVYIIRDILQNKNEEFTYYVMDYSKGAMQSQSVRLIADRISSNDKVVYFLTAQGYNMLLRTKEVDDILGFQIEKVRLKMLVNSKNYTKALDQTKQLIRMLNEKSNELRTFARKLHIDVYSASCEECENLVQSIHSMISEEYSTLDDVQMRLELYQKSLQDDNGEMILNESEELSNMESNLYDINKNIGIIFQKQRTLLTNCMQLQNAYLEAIQLALTTSAVHRFDLQNVVLSQLEGYDHTNALGIDEVCAKLLAPLMFPKFPSTLDVGLFYAPQLRQDDSDETDTLPDGVYLESDELAKHIATRNSAHIAVITLLLQYPKVSGKSSFRLSELWEYYVANWDISTLAKEKLIFLVFLQLYEYGTVDIEIWKNDPNKSHDCQGEFDLSYALGKIYAKHPDMFGVRAMHVFKGKGEVQLSWTDDSCGIPCKQIVNIDDLEFTVEMM